MTGSRARVVLAATVATVVVLVAVLLVVWDRNWRRAGPANPGMSCPTVVPARGRPLLAAVGVRRVMLIGDSIMLQASCAVADGLAGLGITTTRRAVAGSGLLTGTPDWLATIGPLLRQDRPDAVVAIFVGNYLGPPVRDASGNVIVADTPGFRAAWQQKAAQLSHAVHAAGARMYWVSPPPFALPPFHHADLLFDGYASLPGDHVIDAGPALAGKNGDEVGTLVTCGTPKVVRANDAAHLTDDGARIYGQTIAHDLGADLGLLTAPKPC
ncbi:MAG: DUF459 domain-containing protein [Acidimicrobiia bacterium]